MSTFLESALWLAEKGFRVFPVTPGEKDPPLFPGWPESASRDPKVIRAWWGARPTANPAILTTDLAVVDVDVKNGSPGLVTLLTLDLPDTYSQLTPTNGRHLVFRAPPGVQVANRVKFLPGLDSRGVNGYILGAGALVAAGSYRAINPTTPVVDAPSELLNLIAQVAAPTAPATTPAVDLTADAYENAKARAILYLANLPPARQDQRNNLAFRAAAQLKDFGLRYEDVEQLMEVGWNDRAEPPLSSKELRKACRSAFRYGRNAPASAAPEAEFAEVDAEDSAPPEGKALGNESLAAAIEEMNQEYAYVIAGTTGNIIWFTKDHNGQPTTKFLPKETFIDWNAAKRGRVGEKVHPLTTLWMRHPDRRTYRGVVFAPEKEIGADWFNLWEGFAVKALGTDEEPTPVMRRALARFQEHARDNVCRGDPVLYEYLLQYFAHLVQRPWEKPLVALVFRGKKGSGKDTLVDTVGALLGRHYMNTPKRRIVTGDFNSALENCLAVVMNEAFWAHDKQIQGSLQDLITNRRHWVERKGQEPYAVDNLLRLFIVSNEDTVIPASNDERRYTCFQVGDGRVGQPEYFRQLREDMETGGYRYLLRYLQSVDLTGFEPARAIRTDMLDDQVVASLDPVHQWWSESLAEGRLLDGDSATWPETVEKEAIRIAIRRYRNDRKIGGREPPVVWIGRRLKEACKSLVTTGRVNGRNTYSFPPLDVARREWDTFVGCKTNWT